MTNKMHSEDSTTKILLNNLDKKLISSTSNLPLGLAYGKMGCCLYLYIAGKVDGNKEYKFYADQLLEQVVNNSQSISSVDVKEGLAGIGL